MHTRRTVLGTTAGLLGGCVALPSNREPREVELLLNWKPSGLHVPYYVASAAGFYEEEGLSVTIQSGQGSDFSAKQVALGNNRLAITSSDQVLTAASRDLSATAVAAVMQRSPVVVFSSRETFGGELTDPAQLAGKTVGTGPGMVRMLTRLFLSKVGVLADVELVETGYDTVQRLLTGKVDAAGGVFGDAITARHQGHAVDTLPVADEIPSYGHVIAANPDFAADDGEAIRGFLRATARGAARGHDNPEAAIDELLSANESLAASRGIQRDTWDTLAEDFMLSPAVSEHGWGWNERGPWQSIHDVLRDAAQLEGPIDPHAVWTNEYLDTEYRYVGSYADAIDAA